MIISAQSPLDEGALVVLFQAQFLLDALELLHQQHAALLLQDLGLDLRPESN